MLQIISSLLLFPIFATLGATSPISNTHVTRVGSALYLGAERWTASGGNVYWLGLDENVRPPAGQPFDAATNASYPTKERITEILDTMVALGARTVRSQTMGVSVGHPLSVMPELGVVNEKAFESMDWAVAEAKRIGIRIFAPLTDNYDYFHGGKFVFLRWRGINAGASGDPQVQQFYTNRQVIDDFKAYIKVIMTHRNPYTKLTYAEDPTIFAYETGNELGGPNFGDKDVPAAWTEEITCYIKTLGPQKLTIDGTYGINTTHLTIPSVDIFSDHFYPLNITKLSEGVAQVQSVNKVYFAAEYGWTPESQQTGDKLGDFFQWIEKRNAADVSKPVVVGDHFWSAFGHDAPYNCSKFVEHNDGFTLHYNDPADPADRKAQIVKIRQHLFKMQGKVVGTALPPVQCPSK